MRKLICLILLFPTLLLAQVQLLPTIGLLSAPSDADPICFIQHIGNNGGIRHDPPVVGDTMADFTLYDRNGVATTLSSLLNATRKPVLIVHGSWTCPKYTGSISVINDVVAAYPTEITVLVVYAVDAHPDSPDESPYSGTVWTTPAPDGQRYNQPGTYGERKQMVNAMLTYGAINATVLIDGPCNEWWMYFTNWPNNAILVDTNGLIFSFHREFDDFYLDNSPADIFCDIDSLLGNPVSCDPTGNGIFTMNQLDFEVSGDVGVITHAYAEFINTSTESNVVVEFIRRINDIPGDWTTQMCAEICYEVDVDTGYVNLDPGDTLLYNQYFNTGMTPASGSVRITFRNIDRSTNRFMMNFSCVSKVPSGIQGETAEADVKIFPNPFSKSTTIQLPIGKVYELRLFDLNGKLLQNRLDVQNGDQITKLIPGIYMLQLLSDEAVHQSKLIVY